jgi:serine/threonine protein kinase
MLQAGEQIGPYTLIKQLGRGGFGLVWLAERRGAFATTQVALKLALDDEPNMAALAKESQLWAQLGTHNNVLPIIEADKYGDYMVLVSEYAPDGSLDGWLKRHKGAAPSIEIAISMTVGILNGLEHLHSKKIIHRDLKPANILLQGETPRLADFGLARVLKTTMQSTGVAGTPAYMAPEVFSGERFVQSDLWSVGVILYQLLSGRLPFPQNDVMALLGAIAGRNPEPLPDYVPSELIKIIAQALQKDISQRFQSAKEMRLSLQQISSKGNIVAVDAKIEDEKPTAILDTLPGVGVSVKGLGQALETLPTDGFKVNGNQKTQIINDNTFKEIQVVETYKQIGSETIDFISSKAIERDNVALVQKAKNHRVYETLVVGFVMVFMLSFTFLKSSNYSATSNVEPKVDKIEVPETSEQVSSENVLLIDNTDVLDPIEEDSSSVSQENQELIKNIIVKSISLEQEMEKVVDKDKKKSLKNRFTVIQEKLKDSSLNPFDPTSKMLYQAYLLNLESLSIETKAYLREPSLIAVLPKELGKKQAEEKSKLGNTIKFIEEKAELMPDGKEKESLKETCTSASKDINNPLFNERDIQLYQEGFNKLAEGLAKRSTVMPQTYVLGKNSANVKSYSFTNQATTSPILPKPPKPPKAIESNTQTEIKISVPFSEFDGEISPEHIAKYIGKEGSLGFLDYSIVKDSIVIKTNKIIFESNKVNGKIKKLGLDKKIKVDQAREN